MIHTWSKCRIENVNIYSNVDLCTLNSLANLVDYFLDSQEIDLASCDDVEAAADVVTDVSFRTGQWGADACVDRGIEYKVLY